MPSPPVVKIVTTVRVKMTNKFFRGAHLLLERHKILLGCYSDTDESEAANRYRTGIGSTKLQVFMGLLEILRKHLYCTQAVKEQIQWMEENYKNPIELESMITVCKVSPHSFENLPAYIDFSFDFPMVEKELTRVLVIEDGTAYTTRTMFEVEYTP